MAAQESKVRPNIRVEIRNNLADEPMEVATNDSEDDEEEGEILDDKQKITFPTSQNVINFKPTFTTGINIFDKDEQIKLLERAKRFQLKPEEISNFTDDDLHVLYTSLGISGNETHVRFEAVHLRGIEKMGPEDVLNYFLKYAPNDIEWIDPESCNVVWSDKISAARALHFISKPIRGMPIRNPDPFESVDKDIETTTSILLKNREVEIQHDTNELENSVDVSTITAKIPPGYWRLGTPHPKSKNLLVRFAMKTDKKPFRNEPLSRYHKSFSTLAGVERKIRARGIFDRNKELSKSEKNPWGVLAKTWDDDRDFRERERIAKDEEKVVIKNPVMLGRLGNKRQHSEDGENQEEETNDEQGEQPEKKKIKIPRMRMYADEEEEKIRRMKLLKTITKQIEKIDEAPDRSDLRDLLGTTNRKLRDDSKRDAFDLGSTLKNRNKKMIFAVESETQPEVVRRKDSIRSRLEERKSPIRHRRTPERRYHRSKRRSEEKEFSDHEYDHQKPKSKVAVVIRTARQPTVASTVNSVWSRVDPKKATTSSSEESSSSSSSESSSDSEESSSNDGKRKVPRPGFTSSGKRVPSKAPLKIEISNNHFKE